MARNSAYPRVFLQPNGKLNVLSGLAVRCLVISWGWQDLGPL